MHSAELISRALRFWRSEPDLMQRETWALLGKVPKEDDVAVYGVISAYIDLCRELRSEILSKSFDEQALSLVAKVGRIELFLSTQEIFASKDACEDFPREELIAIEDYWESIRQDYVEPKNILKDVEQISILTNDLLEIVTASDLPVQSKKQLISYLSAISFSLKYYSITGDFILQEKLHGFLGVVLSNERDISDTKDPRLIPKLKQYFDKVETIVNYAGRVGAAVQKALTFLG